MKNLYAIVIDFDGDEDGVSSQLLRWLMLRFEDKNLPILSPTFITNSGHGLHLFYVFKEPVPMFNSNKRLMKELYEALHKQLYDARPQRHHLSQAYRIIGSRTKINTVTTAFRTGELYDVNDLLIHCGLRKITKSNVNIVSDEMLKLANSIYKKLGVTLPEDMDDWKQVHEYIALNKPAFDELNKKNKSKRFSKPDGIGWGSLEWYEHMKQQIIIKSPDGFRYTSLMALMVIAFKCNVPFEQVKKDEDEIILLWQRRGKDFSHRFNEAYRDRIDNCYDAKYIKVTKEQLEQWLGFEMHSKVRRNGQKQADHLEEIRMIRDLRCKRRGVKWDDNNGRKTKQEQVQKWKKLHPEGTPKQCIEDTGLNKNTVYKWWK